MDTTIQVSKELVNNLNKRKLNPRESYEDVIWDLLEDTMELSEETKRDIEIAREEYKRGEVVSFEEVKRKMRSKRKEDEIKKKCMTFNSQKARKDNSTICL